MSERPYTESLAVLAAVADACPQPSLLWQLRWDLKADRAQAAVVLEVGQSVREASCNRHQSLGRTVLGGSLPHASSCT